MQKNLINAVMKFIFVVVFLILTCVIIWAAGVGALPFYHREVDVTIDNDSSIPNISIPDTSHDDNNSTEVIVPDFKMNLSNIHEKASYSDYEISDKVFDKNNTIFTFAKKEIQDDKIQSLVPRMGYIFMTKTDGKVSLLDAGGDIIFDEIPEGYEFAGVRDSKNRPLFKNENRYYYLDGDVFDLSSYVDGKDDRGIVFDYPSYYGASSGNIEKYKYRNSWGLRRINGQGTVIYPGYKEVYHFAENYAIVVYYDELRIFDHRPIEVARGYLPPLSKGIESLGYFYFDNGLTRVRKMVGGESKEQLIYTDFSQFMMPSDFELVNYYNGILTLKKGDRYGYMKYTGNWLVNPNLSAASPFIEGVASFRNENGKYGMYDKDGRLLLPAVFDYISDCSGGVVVAFEKEHGYYIINKKVLITNEETGSVNQ